MLVRKYGLLALSFLLLAIVLLPVLLNSGQNQKIGLNGQTLLVEIVDTPALRQKGLSGRGSLNKNTGMLFVFEKPEAACIWMKDMKFSIDILWFDKDKKLIDIKENVSPATYPNNFCSPSSASYVLEVPAGFAAQNKIELGDTIRTSAL